MELAQAGTSIENSEKKSKLCDNKGQALWICQLNLLFCTLKVGLEIVYKGQTSVLIMRYVNLRFQSYQFDNEVLPHLHLLLLPRYFDAPLGAGRRIEWIELRRWNQRPSSMCPVVRAAGKFDYYLRMV